VDKEYENLLNLMPNYEAQITGLNNEILDIQDKLGYIASLVESVSKKKSEYTKYLKDLTLQVDLLNDERSVIAKQHENILQVIKIREEELNSELEQTQEEELRKQELGKVTKRQQEKVHQTRTMVADLERKIKTFENKVAGSKAIVKHLNEEAEALKAQQNKYSIDASNAHAKFYQCIEDIKVKNYIIGDLEEKNKVFGKKLKQQRALYEAVRKDRNMYLKSLLDMKENMVTVNKEYQALAHQAKQVKDDIKFKGRRIREAERQHDFIGSENDELKVRKSAIKIKIKTVEKNIEFYQAELLKLKNLISEAAFEKKKKLNVYENLNNEKALLTSQYFKWHTELQKLFESVRSLETLVELDEKHFNQLNERFDGQFEQLKCLNEEQQEMRAVLSNGGPLKREIISMQKEMLFIQIKCAAFAERLRHPVNIHRWKKIEATEPGKFEKILRIHHLQRLLIDKNQEMKDLEGTIGKKERELLEVKTVMLRTAGKDFTGQIGTLKEKIKDKAASMRQMVFEVAQARENITRLTLEINILKERIEGYHELYFEERRRQEEQLKSQIAIGEP
jgi:chromosome segregation ATPase